MGYSYRNGGQITDFWPDNTHDTLYIMATYANCDYEKIMKNEICSYFGIDESEFDILDFEITEESIHTRCLTYDQYDGSDYTDFYVIRKG